jgi:hypothetical protein
MMNDAEKLEIEKQIDDALAEFRAWRGEIERNRRNEAEALMKMLACTIYVIARNEDDDLGALQRARQAEG